MKFVFLKKFSKYLDKIGLTKNKQSILESIELVRSVNYRVGIFIENDSIIFARVAHRKDIYKIFP